MLSWSVPCAWARCAQNERKERQGTPFGTPGRFLGAAVPLRLLIHPVGVPLVKNAVIGQRLRVAYVCRLNQNRIHEHTSDALALPVLCFSVCITLKHRSLLV